MSRAAEVRLDFAGEERLFRLGIGQLRALDEACDCGPMELLTRFSSGTWRAKDLRETVFQALKGGGMADAEATRLVKDTIDLGPLNQYVPLAQGAVLACLVGVEGDDLGESKGEAENNSPSPEESSVSPGSTEQAKPSE